MSLLLFEGNILHLGKKPNNIYSLTWKNYSWLPKQSTRFFTLISRKLARISDIYIHIFKTQFGSRKGAKSPVFSYESFRPTFILSSIFYNHDFFHHREIKKKHVNICSHGSRTQENRTLENTLNHVSSDLNTDFWFFWIKFA